MAASAGEEDVHNRAVAVATDHRAGWRLRHLRSSPDAVAELAKTWLAGWSSRRRSVAGRPATDTRAGRPVVACPCLLSRLALTEAGRGAASGHLADGTRGYMADFAYCDWPVSRRGTRIPAELAETPDRPASLVGLGLALAAIGPIPLRELCCTARSWCGVHRELRRTAHHVPTQETVGSWIGQLVSE